MSDDRVRLIAGVCAVLAVLAAMATAALLGMAIVPGEVGADASGDWGYALIPFAAAIGFGAVAVVLWRRIGED